VLTATYGRPGQESQAEPLLRELAMDEAVFVPEVGSSERGLQRFKIARRLTWHVRHRSKYLEVPMLEHHAFAFTCHGNRIGSPARTLKEFVTMLARLPADSIDGHARRGDFSRWITDVFGDYPLSAEIRKVERRYRRGQITNLSDSLIASIRGRYELLGVGLQAGGPSPPIPTTPTMRLKE